MPLTVSEKTFYIPTHLKSIPLIRIRQQRVHWMFGDVVLSRIKRTNTLQLSNAPAAGQDSSLVGREELHVELLVIQPAIALLFARGTHVLVPIASKAKGRAFESRRGRQRKDHPKGWSDFIAIDC